MAPARPPHADAPEDGTVAAEPEWDFRRWVEPHWGAMCLVAARLAPPEDRDDVLQEALSAAWCHHDRYDPTRGSLRNWLLAITANQARRSRRSRRRFSPLVDVVPAAVEAPDLDLRNAVAALPSRQRAAVELFYFVGLSARDVAEVMGCAEGTVKSTLSAARSNLRAELLGDEHL